MSGYVEPKQGPLISVTREGIRFDATQAHPDIKTAEISWADVERWRGLVDAAVKAQ